MRPLIKWILIGLAVLVGGVAVSGYLLLRRHVEEIPEQLPEIAADADPMEIELPAQSDLPPLVLREQTGKTVYLLVDSRESMESGEAKKLRRKLDAWVLPDDTVGFAVGHVKGYGAFSGMIDEMLDAFRDEQRLPMYADYDGVVMDTFNMPAGHFSMIVLGPDGEVLLRHSGDADEEKVEEIRDLLGAEAPPPPPPAPEFSVGGLDNERCAESGCIIVFLDEALAATDIPGLVDEGKKRPSMKKMREGFKTMKRPSIRFVHRVAAYWKLEGSIPGLFVGDLEGVAVEEFETVPSAPELRESLGVGADEAAMVIIDPQGRLAFVETGFTPYYKFSLVRDIIDLPKRDDDDDEGSS